MSRPAGPMPGDDGEAAARRELLERLAHFPLAPRAILDLGGGLLGRDPEASADALRRRFPGTRLIVARLDSGPTDAPAPAARPWWWRAVAALRGDWRGGAANSVQTVAGSFARLPLPDGSVQVVLAHWLVPGAAALETLLPEVRRVLAPGGLFLWTTLGPGTQGAWTETSGAGDPAAGPLLLDMHDLGGVLARAGFIEPVLDVDRLGGQPAATLELIHLAAFAGDRPPDKASGTADAEFVIAADAIGRRRGARRRGARQ